MTRDGALVATNQALARVLGYRSTDDLGRLDLATAVFEAPADLHWLIERAASGGSATIETVWKKKDRTRLSVRLQVVRTNEEWIEVCRRGHHPASHDRRESPPGAAHGSGGPARVGSGGDVRYPAPRRQLIVASTGWRRSAAISGFVARASSSLAMSLTRPASCSGWRPTATNRPTRSSRSTCSASCATSSRC